MEDKQDLNNISEKKNNNIALIIILIVVLAIISGVGYYITLKDQDKNTKGKTEDTEEVEETDDEEDDDFDLDDEDEEDEDPKEEQNETSENVVVKTDNFSDEMINYFRLFSYHTPNAEDDELYEKNKTTLNDLSNTYKNRLAFANYILTNLNTRYEDRYDGFGEKYGEKIYFLSSSVLEKSALQIFGKNYKYKPESFNSHGIDLYDMTYDQEKNVYYTSPYPGDQSTYRYATEFYKTIEKGNTIELYEYVVVYNSDVNIGKTGVFKNLKDAKNFTNPIVTVESGSYYGYGSIIKEKENKKTTYDDDLSDYKDEASQYKITLEKEDTHYIFKSCEKIK